MTGRKRQIDRRALCEEIRLGAAALPFGEPPAGLSSLEADVDAAPEDAFAGIAGLLANAAECTDSERGILATSLCEAGRVLERRAGRPAEAWGCYARALATGCEDAVSLRGLARLSRAARDAGSLRGVLGALLDKVSDPSAIVSLSVEKAAHEIAGDEPREALQTLRAAARRVPGSAPLHVMMLGLLGAGADGAALCETLDALSRAGVGPETSAAMTAACAAIEELGGRPEDARARLDAATAAGGAPAELNWALARVALRSPEPGIAARALDELAAGDGGLSDAFSRLLSAFHACAPRYSPEVRPAATSPLPDAGSPWDLALVDAFRSSDRALEAGVARTARPFVSAAAIAAGLEESVLLAGTPPADAAAPAIAPNATSREAAIARCLYPDDRPDADALLAARAEAPVPALHVALSGSQPELAAEILGALGASPSVAEAAHEIGAARASILRNALGRAADAVEALEACSPSAAAAPLASLTRLHRRTPDALAAVARAEADAAGDDEARSWCLAWAGHHLSQRDRDEAERLFREALALNPTCGIALHAIDRMSGDHAATAGTWLAAAASAAGDSVRKDDLVKAGVHFAIAGSFAAAADALAQASELARGDRTLDAFATRLALVAKAPGDASARMTSVEGMSLDDLVAVGSLSLEGAPELALRCFERACDLLPGDPVAEMGVTEVRYACGRSSEVYGELLSILKTAGTPEEEAFLYSRLAEIDEHFSSDPGSAVLSRVALGQRLPLHRHTLAALVVHFARKRAEAELAEALVGVSRAVEDDLDAAAAAATAFRLAPASLDALRSLAARSPSSVYAAVELEARTDDPRERASCLGRLAVAPDAAAVHVSRFADLHEELGESGTALALRRRALGLRPDSVLDLLGLARLQRATSDHAGLLESLRRMAALTGLPDRRKAHMIEAARLAAEELGDSGLAAGLALEALEQDPGDQEVFAFARRLMASRPDPGFADRALEARIAGTEDREEKRALLLEQVSVRQRSGDPRGAKESLARIIALFPADLETRRGLAAFHQRDGEWAEAIAQLFEAARYVQDATVGVGLFHELGALYQDHSERLDLAEKCFMKVLSWDRTHFASMERLAALYEKTGNWIRRAQALEHLIGLAGDPAVRTGKIAELAEVSDLHLDKSREAEQMLNEARRTAPLDIRPVEGLAAIYRRQRDSLALNILLDQAQTVNAAAVAERPGDAELYANLLAILSLKGEDDLAAMAETALSLLGAPVPEKYRTNRAEPWWNIGLRLGEGTVWDFLCPKHVTPGLRETLAAVEEPVAKLLGAGAKNVSSSPSHSKLDRKHPLAQLAAQFASAFGVRGEPAVYSYLGDEIRVAPGSPPAVIVPKAAADSGEEPTHRFAAAAALSLNRMGLSLATMIPAEELGLLIAACVRLAVPGFELKGVDPGALAREVERLRPAIPHKLVERIHPFAFDCAAALGDARLRDSVRTAGLRAGFIGAGTFSAAITALRTVSGRPGAPFGEVRGLGGLVSFVFGKVHSELRQRLGI